MSIVFDPFTGQIIDTGSSGGGGGSIAIGNPISGATANSVLVADGSLNLDNVELSTNGQLLIGSNGSLPVAATLIGNTHQVVVVNGPGSITLGLPQDIDLSSSPTFANLTITGGGSIDVNSPSPSQILNIGSTNASTINIGNAGADINIYGDTFYQNVTNLNVADKNITVNNGGSAYSSFNSGIHVYDGGVADRGYFEVASDMLGWDIKAPYANGIISFRPGASGFTIDQGSHNPVTIGTGNGLSLSGQAISLALSSGSTTGALSSTDWSTFNSKEPALTKGNLSESTSSVLTITGGTGSVIGSGTTIQVKQSSGSQSGYLSSTDWSTFNSKEPALTKGNLTESTSSVLTITGGSNSVIGSGTSIQVKQSSGVQSGYLSSTDWSTFNGKPDLTSTAAQSVSSSNTAGTATDAARSDHTHKGVSSFAKNGSSQLFGDVTISASSGITLTQVGNDISIAATTGGGGTVTSVSVVSANGLAGTVATATTTPAITLSTTVTGLLKGNGTAISAATAGTDYQAPITQGNLTESTSSVLTISGGSNAVIGSGTSIQVKQSSSLQSGYLSSTDWSTFNGKQDAITGAATTITSSNLTASRVLISNASGKVAVSTVTDTTLGYLDATSSIQTQLNGKEPTLTKGNLTESTSSVLTISGGSSAVIGSGTSIQVKQSSSSQSGYLSSTDWSTFNGKPNLTSTAALSVTTANAAGTATDAARSDHTHRGVASFAKNGSTALYGDVTISAGTNVTLTQVGNDISIAATGGGGGSGTVTSVSVVSSNGFAGTVANATTTPAITLTTSVTGILKGNGTAMSAATAGTDYEIAQLGSTPSSYPITLTSSDNNKVFYMNTTAARTINLPAAISNFKFTIKDISGQCGTNAITIARNGSESIEGVAANFSCQCDYGIWTFFCDGTNYYLI